MEKSVQKFLSWMDKQSKNMLSEEKKMVAVDEMKIEDSTEFKDNRAPKCARCRNHGVVNSLKGHKHFCQWKNCNCPRCQVVVERQRITASRVASLRQQRKLNGTSEKRIGNILKFHDNMSPDRNLINLDNVKYLRQMNTQYGSLDSDNDSERADSSGTPASLSPPSSPPSSIASGEFDTNHHRRNKPSNTSYCKDPSCYECWKISQYMLKTNINKLKATFPMLPTKTLEYALSRSKGDISLATKDLFLTLQVPNRYGGIRPCTDPDCKECEYNKMSHSRESSPPMRRIPLTFTGLSRKRTYEYIQPKYQSVYLSTLPKRPHLDEYNKYSRKSPVQAPSESEKREETKTRIISPPTLIKHCIDCSSQISIDDKFCGKCGFKQMVKSEQED